MKGWAKKGWTAPNRNEAGFVSLKSGKAEFSEKRIKEDQNGFFRIIKNAVDNRYVPTTNIYVPERCFNMRRVKIGGDIVRYMQGHNTNRTL